MAHALAAVIALWVTALVAVIVAHKLTRIPHADAVQVVLIRRTAVTIILITGVLVAASVGQLVAIPSLVVTVYSLILPVAIVAALTPILRSYLLLLSHPFAIGENITLLGLPQPISGCVFAYDLTGVRLRTDHHIVFVSNEMVSSAIIERAPRPHEVAPASQP